MFSSYTMALFMSFCYRVRKHACLQACNMAVIFSQYQSKTTVACQTSLKFMRAGSYYAVRRPHTPTMNKSVVSTPMFWRKRQLAVLQSLCLQIDK